MKPFLICLLLCVPWLPLEAQCARDEYRIIIGLAQEDLTARNYQRAINRLLDARDICPDEKEVVNGLIKQAFEQIEGEKTAAIAARKQAETERQRADSAFTDLRAQTASVFESFASLGTRLLYTLDYDQALENMQVAIDIGVDSTLKRQRLAGPLAELLYVFAEGGRRPAQARTAAGLLLRLQPADSALTQALKRCGLEGWETRRQFAPLLKLLPDFPQLQTRYYPTMIPVPLGESGIFQMGSPASEPGRQSDERRHPVKLSPYQMAATPVTFYQFALFCEAEGRGLASRTPYWGRYGDHPAVNVNWYEAIEYANWLNVRQGLPPVYRLTKAYGSDPGNESNLDILKWRADWASSARGYCLPTEAEWELAARGGGDAPYTRYAGSGSLGEVGWYWENSGDQPLSGDWDPNKVLDNNGRTHPVQEKRGNGIGLYDMSGNVFEWCADWYSETYYDECNRAGTVANPRGPETGSYRVIRGGSWRNDAQICRAAFRDRITPYYRSNDDVGFRLVFVP